MILGIPCKHDGTPLRLLTIEDEGDLIDRFHAGDQRAGSVVVLANQPFVMAKLMRIPHPPQLRQDLFQEGILALYRALHSFDPERGMRFTTYAAWWLWNMFQKALARDSRKGIRGRATLVSVDYIEDIDEIRDPSMVEEALETEDLVRKAVDTYLDRWPSSRAKQLIDQRLLADTPAPWATIEQNLGISKATGQALERQILESLAKIVEDL